MFLNVRSSRANLLLCHYIISSIDEESELFMRSLPFRQVWELYYFLIIMFQFWADAGAKSTDMHVLHIQGQSESTLPKNTLETQAVRLANSVTHGLTESKLTPGYTVVDAGAMDDSLRGFQNWDPSIHELGPVSRRKKQTRDPSIHELRPVSRRKK